MRWPGHIPSGTVSNDMAMTIDLLPTIAHLVGADPPKNKIDGLDVWPSSAENRASRRTATSRTGSITRTTAAGGLRRAGRVEAAIAAHVSHAQRPARREGRHPHQVRAGEA